MSASPGTEAERGRHVVGDSEAGERLDRLMLDLLPGRSRAQIQRWIRAGYVRLNGAPARPGAVLRRGDEITWEIPPPRPPTLAPEPIPLRIVYEDDDLIVIDKPKGLVVHPAPGAPTGTLVHAVLAHAGDEFSGIGDEERPGIVHRLDRDTSGLIVVAKTEAAYRSLQQQIQARTAERRYVAVVWGNPRFEQALVEMPIGRHPRDRRRMAVIPPGSPHPAREARTRLRVVERFGEMAVIAAILETGRTHQIRVHAAAIGHPVVGDPLYGPRRPPALARLPPAVQEAVAALTGQALHAYWLAFTHPRTGRLMRFVAPPPEEVQRLLTALGSHWRPPPAREDSPG